MIEEIRVKGFKSLSTEHRLKTTSLNILAGPNASGKSSLLQALLLLRQSSDKEGEIESLMLSGPLYEAGTAQDVFHPSCERKIKLGLTVKKEKFEYNFHINREASEVISERKLQLSSTSTVPRILSERGLNFAYLNAERIGPRVTYSLPTEGISICGLIGKHGEYTTAALARSAKSFFTIDAWSSNLAEQLATSARKLDNKEIEKDLIDTEGRLDLVSNIMLDWVIPGARFYAEESHNTDSTTLRFVRAPGSSKMPTRATHIGFGLTYTLPIIVAALSLKRDGLIIVENPEAHLHPFSQSRIGVFLALIAATGRQVFIETHSDHVINGIRLAVKNSTIESSEVILNSFSRDAELENSEVSQITISKDGRPSHWPEGFFDQIENDLMLL